MSGAAHFGLKSKLRMTNVKEMKGVDVYVA